MFAGNKKTLAIDEVHGYVYWTHVFKIRRANLDGSNVITVQEGKLNDTSMASCCDVFFIMIQAITLLIMILLSVSYSFRLFCRSLST